MRSFALPLIMETPTWEHKGKEFECDWPSVAKGLVRWSLYLVLCGPFMPAINKDLCMLNHSSQDRYIDVCQDYFPQGQETNVRIQHLKSSKHLPKSLHIYMRQCELWSHLASSVNVCSFWALPKLFHMLDEQNHVGVFQPPEIKKTKYIFLLDWILPYRYE